MLEDRSDDIGIFDAGDDAQFAAALGAGLDVDGEDAFQALHPSRGGKGLIRLFVARFAFWHDGLTMLAIRREHAVEPGQVQSRTRDQRRQAGDEVEWVEDDVGGAVAKRLLEPIDDLSSLIGREPLVGDGGPCDVATELFELVALGGFTDGGGVERKARLPGEQGGREGFGLYRDGAQGQCLPAGVGPDGDPVVDTGRRRRADRKPSRLTGLVLAHWSRAARWRVATELFELVALGGFTDGGGVERKARWSLYRDGAQGQCLPAGCDRAPGSSEVVGLRRARGVRANGPPAGRWCATAS